jgi:hypothetical protein
MSKGNITTGVIHQNDCGEFIFDEMMNSICLEYEEHCRECEEEYHDNCWCENGDETELINFLYDEKTEKYIEDESKEYSAIYHNGIFQITRSDYYCFCGICSPCYPGQGDITSKGNIKAYCLPSDLMPEKHGLNILEVRDEKEIDELIEALNPSGLFWQDSCDNYENPMNNTRRIEKIYEMINYLNSDKSITSGWNDEKCLLDITDIREKLYSYEYGMLGEIEFLIAEELQEKIPEVSEQELEELAEKQRKMLYLCYPTGTHSELILQK